jgi:hypothetical protein
MAKTPLIETKRRELRSGGAALLTVLALYAGARCVMAHGRATVEEAKLLRVIATLLECPLPPFLPTVG